jgi:hypothetical protein
LLDGDIAHHRNSNELTQPGSGWKQKREMPAKYKSYVENFCEFGLYGQGSMTQQMLKALAASSHIAGAIVGIGFVFAKRRYHALS